MEKVLYDLVDDADWDVSLAAKKLLGLESDRYAEIQGAPKEKEKEKKKRPSSPDFFLFALVVVVAFIIYSPGRGSRSGARARAAPGSPSV